MAQTSRTFSFDGWSLRADIGDLVKDGRTIRLQQQPLLVLEELLTHPGELVTREQLIARLWPKGIVDFDTGLNTAVRKLRVALDDSGDLPRYIETIPRKGYRFVGVIDAPPAVVAPVAAVTPMTAPEAPVAEVPPPPAAAPTPPTVKRRWPIYALAAGLVLVAAGMVFLFFPRDQAATSVQVTRPPMREDMAISVLPFRSASTEPDATLAKIAGDLLRQRLGKLGDAVVIDAAAVVRTPAEPGELERLAKSLHARYLIDGSVATNKDQAHVAFDLIDARSGKKIASFAEDRAVTELAAVIDKAARDVASELHIPADAIADARVPAPVHMEAYSIYLRAQELMHTESLADAQSALELSRRATVLDPKFARAYLSVAQSLSLMRYNSDMSEAARNDANAEGAAALDRAQALDPALGDIFIERALLNGDSAKAEQLYREGLKLAPNSSLGHLFYADFLFEQYRRGEALEFVDRALVLSPLDPRMYQRGALYHFLTNSNVVEHDRLLNEALKLNPRLVLAMWQLGTSKHVYSGQFADGIKLLEKGLELEPFSDSFKVRLATFYLDVDDPEAALSVLKLCENMRSSLVEVAQYRGDPRRAAELARQAPLEEWRTMWSAPEATALRDEAISTGDFALVLEREAKLFPTTVPQGVHKSARPREWNRTLNLVYAHTLVAAGETQRGRKIATEILAQIDGESVGRPKFFFSRDRATAYAILGDKEKALEELENSLKINHYYLWWYLAERDPLFEGLKAEPRFQALAARAKQHRVEQRALLEEMRRNGQVPKR